MSVSIREHHSAFKLIRSERIDTLDLDVQEFEHIETGAKHFHLAAENQENVFMVALRTVPMSSNGVAHVLEHTALCGSERFPVRDPFFLMIRRSLNTFMNAFTTSDYTAYPFASQNKKDFGNLLDIYLDAVFFSRLDPLDFMQEGHRIEFETPDDPSTDLVYRGVVYNEMKGDTSSVVSVLYDEVKKHLFPTTTYHYNSGGDPKHIPELTYEGLQDFYRSHYHPSNAIFMTFGDKPVAELQQEFEEKALHRFSRSDVKIEVKPEQRFTETKKIQQAYGTDDKEQLEKKTHIVMAWLLGPNTDLEMLLKCNLLADVLLDTAASPLRHALENTDLGVAPSPLCGLEETNHEMSFLCGIEGSNVESADAVEQLIISTLERVVEEGIAIEKLDACLHQLELNQREIGGDGHPFGLQLMFSCMSAAIHRGDPIRLLDLDPVLASLRAEIEAPDFIKNLIQELLLDNAHRVRICLYPSLELNQKNDDLEAAKLQAIKDSLDQDGKNALIEVSRQLKARQDRDEDVDLLPKVGLEDIADSFSMPEGQKFKLKNAVELTQYIAGTNGLVYHQIICDLPNLAIEELRVLPLFTQVITEIGSKGRSYLESQHIQHSVSGGIGVYSAMRAKHDDADAYLAHITFSSRGLNRNVGAMFSILQDTFSEPNFNEVKRIKDLIKQTIIRRVSSIGNNGHGLAMSAAASYFRPVSRLNYNVSGLAGIKYLKELNQLIENESDLSDLIQKFRHIQDLIMQQETSLLLIADENFIATANACLEDSSLLKQKKATITKNSDDNVSTSVPFARPPQDQAWLTTTQVNYCACVYATVAENHADSAALTILAGVLRNGFLHKAIREQGGAYGGGAGHDTANGVFRFYSYRDPNIMSTFEAFQASIDWVIEADIEFEAVESSILGVISSIDAPGSPSGDARQAFHNALFGRNEAIRDAMRQNLLDVTVADIKRVAASYLTKTKARAVVMNDSGRTELPASFEIEVV